MGYFFMATHGRSQCPHTGSLVERGCIVINCGSLVGRLAGLLPLGREGQGHRTGPKGPGRINPAAESVSSVS